MRFAEKYGCRLLTVKEIFDGHGDFNLVMMQKKLVPNYETFDDSFVFTGVQIGKRTAFGSWKAPDNGKPLLYSSLGTAFNNWPEYYPILFDAVRDLDINVFAALGSIDPASLKDIPANVEVGQMVPQLDILSQASVFITHAGMGGTGEAIYYGVPMIAIPQMEELGLTVLAVKPEDQDKLYGAIDLLAQATNTVARGEELKSAIEDNLLSLHEAIGDAEAPTVYMAGNSSVLQTAGPAMYQNYMIENAGGLNAAASVEDTYWAEVSYEQVLDWDPDYIILASDADYDVDSVLNDAALADCTAVREGHVYQLPHAIEAVDSPVPGSFLGSVYLGSVLHPEQVSEQFYHDCADTFYTTYYGFTPASYE